MDYNEPIDQQPTNAVTDYTTTASPPPKNKKKLFIILMVIIVLIVFGVGIWKFTSSKKPANAPASTQAPTSAAQTNTVHMDIPDSTGTGLYENGFLGVKLTYPTGWTATETDNKDGVRLESPIFNYQANNKGQVAGNFRIYIRKGARDADGKYIGRGYAIQPSEKLTYKSPAVGQRPETNLSLFGLDTPDNFAFFMIAGNYSLNKGETLGPNYGKEAETYIIAGGFSSKELKDDLATNPVAVELIQSSNAYKQALEILKSLQLR